MKYHSLLAKATIAAVAVVGLSLASEAKATWVQFCGYVYQDCDNDGIFDPGERPIEGVAVTLSGWQFYPSPGFAVSAAVYTDANGRYCFTVAPGRYTVTETQPSGYFDGQDTLGQPNITNDVHQYVAVVNDAFTVQFFEDDYYLRGLRSIDNNNFGEVTPVSIGDYVWVDTNHDGIQDADEQGLEGVTVLLKDCALNTLATTTTDAGGHYLFPNLAPGNYSVQFVLPAGYVFSPANQGSDDTKDSDANPDPASGVTDCITLICGQDSLDWDAGVYRLPQYASIGDFVWKDSNRNGIQDADETGVENVTVHLMDCMGNVLATTTTDANGHYLFANLTPGNYNIHFVLPVGYLFSPAGQGGDPAKDSDADPATGMATCTTLDGNEVDLSWDAGIYPEPQVASIGDFVWKDSNRNGIQDAGEVGVGNVTVHLMDCAGNVLASTTTDASGHYLFSGLTSGNYNIQFVLPTGYAFSPANQGGDATKDSDADPATGLTACTTLDNGEADMSWDAGIYKRCSPGTGTPGYWKNHPEAWPVRTITIGGVVYTKAQAITWLKKSVTGDKRVTMFKALVCAKLNVLIGNEGSCVADAIVQADQWMATYGSAPVAGSSAAWQQGGNALATLLDDYNNGRLCAPHRD